MRRIRPELVYCVTQEEKEEEEVEGEEEEEEEEEEKKKKKKKRRSDKILEILYDNKSSENSEIVQCKISKR